MRAGVIGFVLLLFVIAFGPPSRPVAQDGKQLASANVAEQLAAQVQQWFTTLGSEGRMPRVFTGITRDIRQLIIEIDSLPYDDGKRRDFLIWLAQRYGMPAYAYATPLAKAGASEGLAIHASSAGMDVLAEFSVTRQPNGKLTYSRNEYKAQPAATREAPSFLGLHRTTGSTPAADAVAFEQAWATLEGKALWLKVHAPPPTTGAVDDNSTLVSRALALYAAGNCNEALPLGEKAADLLLKRGQEHSSDMAWALVAQGLCHKQLARPTEAERLYRQAIDIHEKASGPNSSAVAITLDNLASLYSEHGRFAEAEGIRLRALAIFKAGPDPASPHIALALQNLATGYQYQGRFAEAQEKFLEALPIAEKAFGPDSRQVAGISDNLAGVYRARGLSDKAEPLYVRAIATFEKTLGREHLDTAVAMQNHALLLSETGKHELAEARLKDSLAITERNYGSSHSTVAAGLNALVLLYAQQQRWTDALAPARKAAKVSVELSDRGKLRVPSEGGQTASPFRRLVQVIYGAGADNAALMDEAYIAAQRALNTTAALALSQLASRHASGDGALARLMRERQDLMQENEVRDKSLIAIVAKPPDKRDRAGENDVKTRITEIGKRITEIDAALGQQFPQFAALSKAAPISIAETQALLGHNEVLFQTLDVQGVRDLPETGFAWLITRDSAEWVKLPFGTQELSRRVSALRCGLDARRWELAGEQCASLLKVSHSDRTWLPFDLGVAHDLHQALLGPFAAKLKGKHLMFVPSGALTVLPLSVLVTERPHVALPVSLDGYRKAAWLGAQQAITVLPSAGSLQALRRFAKESAATKPYLGVGNPLLDGRQHGQFGEHEKKLAELARAKQKCGPAPAKQIAANGGAPPRGFGTLFRGATADIDALREWAPLPETADELCEVGRRLGAPKSEVLLGNRATESALKDRSEEGRLADYSILHFATHGALTGDVQGSAEPGLILTPPGKTATDAKALQRDDGFLTASEIATLKLDADWVILSACNTAGGSGETAEALSGMARAFFYAGARALLVSHWEVGSDSAVRLVTRAFGKIKANPKIGRAEALRASMKMMIEKGPASRAHPEQWAPFVVVGEGSAPVRVALLKGLKTGKAGTRRGPEPDAGADWMEQLWR